MTGDIYLILNSKQRPEYYVESHSAPNWKQYSLIKLSENNWIIKIIIIIISVKIGQQ
jgi:hypothetical protein